MKRTEEDVAGQDFKRIWTKSFFIGLEIEKKSSELTNLLSPCSTSTQSRHDSEADPCV